MLKCVAYCRVSSDSEEQLNSLENQIKHYSELFKREGFKGAQCGMYYAREGKQEMIKHVPSIFADEGISGTKLKNREAFKYMLECAYRKEFDIIYVKNVQRWARFVVDGSKVLKDLKVIGIKVIFEDGNLNNFEHEMVINMFLSMAQEESRAKSTAIQFGIRKAQKAGKFTSAAPYGYYLENGYLKTIPEQADVVQKIYDLYIDGMGGVRIARQLNNENVPTQKNRQWSQIQIFDILSNAIYIGKQITHTVKNTDVNVDSVKHYEGNKEYIYRQQKPVDEEEWIVTINEDLRVVSDELFNEVQRELKKRKELHGKNFRYSADHIFSNLFYCRHCGGSMRRKKLWGWKRKDGTRKFGVEWICTNHDMHHNEVCEYRNSWHEDKLIERVKEEILRLRENKEILDQVFLEYMKSFYSSEEVSEKIESLQEQLLDIKKEASANLKLFSKDIIDEEQYKVQNDELQNNKKEIESELYKFQKIDEERAEARRKYHNYNDFINNVDINNLDNKVLKRVINKIESFTITNKDGKQVKDIYIVWNMMDRSFDDIFYKRM